MRIGHIHTDSPASCAILATSSLQSMNRFLVLLLSLSSSVFAAPNFVFFITDDISPDDLGIYGNTVVKTPNLDALAERGLVFDNACNVISSCSPSRCAIITGRYPHNTGAPELHSALPADQVTFVQKLREAGYHTMISGKNHMSKPEALADANLIRRISEGEGLAVGRRAMGDHWEREEIR